MASKDKVFYSNNTLNLGGNLFDLTTPKIMGILNVTDDSFYDGGRYTTDSKICLQVEKLIDEGADIIDLGGYSSRPGALHIDQQTEHIRIKKGLKSIKRVSANIPISVDTFRTPIAEMAIDNGANIINDISGGEMDDKMYAMLAAYKVPYVMMHMAGTPQNMSQNIHYDNLITDIVNFFAKKLQYLTKIGVKDVIIDVGFGFSKTTSQNFYLLNHLEYFRILDVPILTGISRKSMIYKILNTMPKEALNGTTVGNTIAVLKGSQILRVHDVREAKEILKLINILEH